MTHELWKWLFGSHTNSKQQFTSREKFRLFPPEVIFKKANTPLKFSFHWSLRIIKFILSFTKYPWLHRTCSCLWSPSNRISRECVYLPSLWRYGHRAGTKSKTDLNSASSKEALGWEVLGNGLQPAAPKTLALQLASNNSQGLAKCKVFVWRFCSGLNVCAVISGMA